MAEVIKIKEKNYTVDESRRGFSSQMFWPSQRSKFSKRCFEQSAIIYKDIYSLTIPNPPRTREVYIYPSLTSRCMCVVRPSWPSDICFRPLPPLAPIPTIGSLAK